MVELSEQIKGSDTTEKGTDGTKDTHQEAGVVGRQSSYTQDPHQGSRQPSVVVPAQGDWAAEQHVGIGSVVVISNINPPMCGTIRWIGTIPQVNGYVAGVELVSVT